MLKDILRAVSSMDSVEVTVLTPDRKVIDFSKNIGVDII